jgi:hypothetical protein
MHPQTACARQLWRELHDFEGRYNIAKGQLSADELFALQSALWRFSKKVMVDHGQVRAAERKRRRTGR